jgi:predicted PurR-regulated permease PerM
MAQPLNELEGAQQRWTLPWPLRMLLAAACVVIIVAGLKAVAPILSTFLFAMLLALVLTPIARFLMRWRVPRPLAIALTMLAVFVAAALVIYLVIGSVSELSGNLPAYNQRYLALREQVFGVLQGYGVDTSKLLNVELLEPGKMVKPAASIVGRVLADLGHTFFVLLITTFLLVEFTALFERLEVAHAAGERTTLVRFGELAGDIQKYVGISAVMGLIGATCYFVLLKVMGLSYVATWVVLFFVLSFVPTIGGPLAVAPVLLLMLLEQGIERTIIFTVVFILFNSFLGDIIKPRLMQKGFEIGIVAIFFSLVFWNFVLGPVGIVLAVPLTITLRRLMQEYAPEVRQALTG